jgi:outer membrane protein assembly factor BamD (BamD/ComL family)
MKALTILLFACVITVATSLTGCKNEQRMNATKPLAESFQSATPEVQQAVAKANASLKTGNYEDATRALVPVISQQRLTEAQKQAVGLALRQINQAIAANPTLDTKEMYDLRAKMFHAVHGDGGF